MSDFYYQAEIEKLTVTCPPAHCVPIRRNSFRWVFDDMDDERNFKAQAEKNPKVLNDKTDEERCEYYALSFHRSLDESKRHFHLLLKNFPLAYKRLGTHVAAGMLDKSDGLADTVDKNGHFNFHPFKDHLLRQSFTIVSPL